MGGDSSSGSGSGSGSDDGGGRGHEWEVVSLSLSSHSLSASTSLDAGTGQGGNGVDTFATALHSGYFLCSPRSSSSPEAAAHESLSNKNGEERPSITEPDPDDGEEKKKKTEETASEGSDVGLSEEASPATQDTDEMEEEHDGGTRRRRRDALLPVVARSCASQMQQPELSGMEWLTPMTTAVDYEQDEMGRASILYGLASDSKAGAEPDFGQAGPLLGSCLSSPSSPMIVSRSNSTQLLLREEVFHGEVDEGDENKAPACLVEEEVPSLAGLERDIFGENSGFEFADSGESVDSQKMETEDTTKSSAPVLGDGCDEQTYEAWWRRQTALWYVQARQANTLWSIALAATVMGLVIIGHRWQHERYQNQQLRLQLCSKDEKISQLGFQIARLKEALSGRRRVPVLRTSSSYSSFLDRL